MDEEKNHERFIQRFPLESIGTNLDEVAQDLVGLAVFLLDQLELIAQTQREGLELQVGVLSSGDLVFVDIGVAGSHGGRRFERSVQVSGLFPISGILADLAHINAWNKYAMESKFVSHYSFHQFGFWGDLLWVSWKVCNISILNPKPCTPIFNHLFHLLKVILDIRFNLLTF